VAQPEPERKPDPSASRAIVEEAARRCLTKEAKALARAAKKLAGKPQELRAWVDQFYAQHHALVARTFAAPLRALGQPIEAVERYARQHCDESIRAIVGAIQTDTLDDVIEDFEGERATDIANQFVEGEDHGNAAAA